MKLLFQGLIFFISLQAYAMDKYCNGVTTIIHGNGGGRVAITASVALTAYVASEASVCEFAIVSGTAEIRDESRVYGFARIGDGTILSENAEVYGNSTLTSYPPLEVIHIAETSKIFGNARIYGSSTIKGSAKVFENSRIINSATIEESSQIYGNATISGTAVIKGNSRIHGRAMISGNVVALGTANICSGQYFEQNTILDSNMCTASGPLLLPIVQIAAGSAHTCNLNINGRIRCWGLNTSGQLGYGNTVTIGDNELPSSVGYVDVGGKATQIGIGAGHTCALLESGNVRCWGSNTNGALGYPGNYNIGDNEHPSSVGDVDVGGTVTQIAVGALHTCALLNNNKVRCWGSGASGRLGYGNTDSIGDNETPSAAGDVDVGGNVTQITAGMDHTCALLDTGTVRCWGSAYSGKLGYGNTNAVGDDELPSSVGDIDIGGSGTIVQIAAGGYVTCAVYSTGVLRCWGATWSFPNPPNIGDDELPSTALDMDLAGNVVQVSVGREYICAVMDIGTVKCWGRNVYGQLGYGNNIVIGDNESPSTGGEVSIGGTATQISLGDYHVCALLSTGKALCWGRGTYGMLGYGNQNNIGDTELPSHAGVISSFY